MKRISATSAKNNFGGLLDDVATLGRVDIVKHGRLVAVVLSPQRLATGIDSGGRRPAAPGWGKEHMIPARRARAARLLSVPSSFDEE